MKVAGENERAVSDPMSIAAPRLAVDGVSHWFETPDHDARVVLDGIDLTIRGGEFVCLVGASGCGKTTLLRIIAGLTKPSTGSVVLDGTVIRAPTQAFGFVFQANSLMPWRTVNGNVGLGLELRSIPRADREKSVRNALRMVGLTDFGRHFPRELSGGMRQRINIARALALSPSVLLMDEPFAALDAQTREIMQAELLALIERLATTVVFVTHQIEEAVLLADRIVILSASPGRVREITVVPFARPRSATIRRTPEFTKIVDHIWGLIESDVRQGLASELEQF